MEINEKKLARQVAFVEDKWIGNKAIGILEACTGYGKTYVLILAIQLMNKRNPNRTTIVVVPRTNLKNDWIDPVKGHIVTHGLLNVTVYVVNTFVKEYIAGAYKYKCHLLGLDEIHNYASEDAVSFNKVIAIVEWHFLLGLSATLNEKEKKFLAKSGISILETITLEEAEAEGFVAKSISYNLGIHLSDTDKEYIKKLNDTFNHAFAKFNHEFELAQACRMGGDRKVRVRLKAGTDLGYKTGKEWRTYWANKMGWQGRNEDPWSPSNIAKYAHQFGHGMSERRDFLYNLPSKVEIAASIIEKFKYKTITFSESTKFADELTKRLGSIARAYHSNLETEIRLIESMKKGALFPEHKEVKFGKEKRKKEALSLIEDPNSEVRAICTAKALDEGMNVESISMALKCSYSSSARQLTQRDGRSGRIDNANLDKIALNINLYVIGTQEEKWLKESQKNSKKAIWIESIEDIKIDRELPLKVKLTKEIEV